MTPIEKFSKEFNISLSPMWQQFFAQELQKNYFPILIESVQREYQNYQVYPPKNLLWNAFILTPFENLQGVLLGQDPYHNENQACGLSFSVPLGQKIPPSLKNVYKELQRTHGHVHAHKGDLTPWAQQGILLLNTVLTVRAGQPLSHKHLEWEKFTDAVIQFIHKHHPSVFFFLWGSWAQKKASLMTSPTHMAITAPHPSPLSRKTFVGCDCFTEADQFLKKHNRKKIFW